MKKFFSLILIGLLCIACLCGCKGKKEEEETTTEEATTKVERDASLEGTWEEWDIPEGQEFGDYWVFESNGKGKWGLMDVDFTYTTKDGVVTIDCDGGWGEYEFSYYIDGDILTLQEAGNSANEYRKK